MTNYDKAYDRHQMALDTIWPSEIDDENKTGFSLRLETAWAQVIHRSGGGSMGRISEQRLRDHRGAVIAVLLDAIDGIRPAIHLPPAPKTESADEGLEYYVDELDSAQPYDTIVEAMAAVDAAISTGAITAKDVEVMEYQRVYRRMDYRQADHERQLIKE